MKQVDNTVFRGLPFGASYDDIVENEGYPPVQRQEDRVKTDLVYLETLARYEFAAIYSLVNDEFVLGQYLLTEGIDDMATYQEIYGDVKAVLEERYGAPSSHETVGSLDEMERIEVYGETVWGDDEHTLRLRCFRQEGWVLQVLYEHQERTEELQPTV